MSFNRVMLMGEVASTPESVKDEEGRPASSFDLRIERTFQTLEGVERSVTTLVPVLAVGKAYEAAHALRGDGDLAVVEGRIFTESTKVDGRWKNRCEVVALRLEVVAGARRLDAPPAAVAGATALTTLVPSGGSAGVIQETGFFERRGQAPATPPAPAPAGRRGRPGRSGAESAGTGRA